MGIPFWYYFYFPIYIMIQMAQMIYSPVFIVVGLLSGIFDGTFNKRWKQIPRQLPCFHWLILITTFIERSLVKAITSMFVTVALIIFGNSLVKITSHTTTSQRIYHRSRYKSIPVFDTIRDCNL